jgi:hypothetical protein
VFAGVGNGFIKHFDANGNLLDTLNTGTTCGEQLGMGFDNARNLYATSAFGSCTTGQVVKFNDTGTLVGPFGSGFSASTESIAVSNAGDVYVGQPDGTKQVLKFDSAGNASGSFNVAIEDRGSDWIDLSSDQCTIFYTSEGSTVKRFNVCTNTQLADFATGLPSPCYAVRRRPNGEVLVACASAVFRLDANGAVLQSYTLGSVGEASFFFAMNLDPDGTSFWTAGYSSGNVYKIDISTGAVSTHFNAGIVGYAVSGLTVFGEPGHPPGGAQEFKIFGATIDEDEPSLAADPINSQHAVVGFNYRHDGIVDCGWSESTDAGNHWSSGHVNLPSGFTPLGDPWVRFGQDGRLYYSCIGATEFVGSGLLGLFNRERTVGIFVASANSGRASSLGVAATVTSGKQTCPGVEQFKLNLFCNETDGEFTDHPSITVINRPQGTRVIACWVDFFRAHGNTFVEVSYSDDGQHWSKTNAMGAQAEACTMGGSSTTAALTWFDAVHSTLNVRTTTDGVSWTKTATTATVSLVDGKSTSSTVVAVPYGIVFPDMTDGLRSIWESRIPSSHAQVFLGGIAGGPFTSIGDPNAERFLPGASGSCNRLIGAYEVTNANGSFRYKVWDPNASGAPKQLFQSSADLHASDGVKDPNFGQPRFGDYTGIDCSGALGWAAWTDTRNGKSEIWGATIPLPK